MRDASGGCKCDMRKALYAGGLDGLLYTSERRKDFEFMRISYWGLSFTILLTLPASLAATYFDALLRIHAPLALNSPDPMTNFLHFLCSGAVPIAVWVIGATALSLAEGLVANERARLFSQLAFTLYWLGLCILFVNRIITFSL